MAGEIPDDCIAITPGTDFDMEGAEEETASATWVLEKIDEVYT